LDKPVPEKDSPKPVTVVVADDHEMVRDGLRGLLKAAGLRVLAEAADGVEVVSVVRKLFPDILLLDLSMPEHPGLEALTQLHAERVSQPSSSC
jgi:DNA-binding NarL/FixJ family response regulator